VPPGTATVTSPALLVAVTAVGAVARSRSTVPELVCAVTVPAERSRAVTSPEDEDSAASPRRPVLVTSPESVARVAATAAGTCSSNDTPHESQVTLVAREVPLQVSATIGSAPRQERWRTIRTVSSGASPVTATSPAAVRMSSAVIGLR
jgi:hypothetical protein